MRSRRTLVLAALLATPGLARAEPIPREVRHAIESEAGVWLKGTFDRTRRALALGPFLGGHASAPTSNGELDGALSFGLELLYFKVPSLLDPASVKEVLVDRTKAKLRERVKEAIRRGEEPSKEDVKQMALEILEEVREELIGERSRLVEKPAFELLLEGARLFRSDAWQLRSTLGIGISYLSVGPTLVGQLGDGSGVSLGPELGFYLLPKKASVRSPVVQIFARWDFALHGREERADRIELGARFLLDLI